MAKGKKTGGRQAGTPNKDSFPVKEMAERLGIDPLEVMLMVVKGDWKGLGYSSPTTTRLVRGIPIEVELIPLGMRVGVATEAAQYLYPKRKALELSGDSENAGIKIIIEDYGKK